jgi:hypothetical protein
MEPIMTLKIVVPKGKQAAANTALQAVGLASYEEWATSVEGLMVERKAYVKEVRTRYKEYNTKNGAYIFTMEFVGTYGQLVNVFYTEGLVEALELVNPYIAPESMWVWSGTCPYYINYGGEKSVKMTLPPLSDATPRPVPPTPAAPARAEPVKKEAPAPFVEPMPRMSPISVAPVSVAPVSVAPVSVAPVSVALNKCLLVDSEDSVLAFNLNITYNVPRANAEQFEDWVASQWVHFYDAVPLPNEKKFYDVKFLAGVGVNLTASFRTHVDNYADIFTEEALHHLEEVARVCDDDIIYVQAPYTVGDETTLHYESSQSSIAQASKAVLYEPILTHFVRVGKTNGFACCFGGEGEAAAPALLPPVQVAQRVPSKDQNAMHFAPKQPMVAKAEQRYNELGSMAHHLEEEIRELKEEQAEIQAQIAEKELRIRMFQFAQDELYDTMMF